MKYSIDAEIYWFLFKSEFKKEISSRWGKDYANIIIKKTKNEYKQLVKRVPDIGGKENKLIRNIYICSIYIAFYIATDKSHSPRIIGEILSNNLKNSSLVKNACKRNDQTSKKYKKWIRNVAEWTQKNENKFKSNWLLYYDENMNNDDAQTYIEFRRCALYEICKSEGCIEISKELCKADFITADFGKAKLVRKSTIAEGANKCDFHYIKQ